MIAETDPFRAGAHDLKLDLGCGGRKKPGFLGVDLAGDDLDIRMDVFEFLKKLPTESVQEIYSRHYMEHVAPEDFPKMMKEIDRVLAPGGKARIIVPHYSNPYYYSDPTHRQPFAVHTFSYVCKTSCLPREVPKYASIDGWNLADVSVRFETYKRPRLFGVRLPVLSDLLNRTVNLSPRNIEIFERYFASVFSIYEVSFGIEKVARP